MVWTCSDFKKIHIEEGQYINLDFAVLIPIDSLDKSDWTKYGAFLVGRDLAAGEYKISSENKANAAYQVTNGEPDGDVVKFSKIYTQEYVSLSDGQYIMINDSTLIPVGN